MPTGGLIQLHAQGSENIYLSGNPQITFFKSAYQRHTNFSYEWIPEYFDSSLTFDTTNSIMMKMPIKRHGDLLCDTVLVIDLPNIFSSEEENFRWVKNIGHVLLYSAEFTIGAHSISKLYGQWMNIWYELSTDISKREGFNELIGNVKEIHDPTVYYGEFGNTSIPTIRKRRLRIPLPFWFSQNPGLALPLIAIQFTEVSIQFDFRCLNDLFTIGKPSVSPKELFDNPSTKPGSNHTVLREKLINSGYTTNNVFWKFVSGLFTPGVWNQNIYVDNKFVFLENKERVIFSSNDSEYLITQVEKIDFKCLHGVCQEDIKFFHPVKEMIWVFQRDDIHIRNQWTNYTTLYHEDDYKEFVEKLTYHKNASDFGLTPTSYLQSILPSGITIGEFLTFINSTDSDNLSLSNIDAFDNYLNIMYFGEFLFNANLRQNRKSTIYYTTDEPYHYHTSTPKDKQIHLLSFAENPESINPSGSANFSVIKNIQFNFTLKNKTKKNNSVDCELFNLYFYVRNINILKIKNGIGGLIFAN